jgi:hypothetical protein
MQPTMIEDGPCMPIQAAGCTVMTRSPLVTPLVLPCYCGSAGMNDYKIPEASTPRCCWKFAPEWSMPSGVEPMDLSSPRVRMLLNYDGLVASLTRPGCGGSSRWGDSTTTHTSSTSTSSWWWDSSELRRLPRIKSLLFRVSRSAG